MAETGRQFKSRQILLALLGILSLGLAPGSARASGCHVPERPVLARAPALERLLQAGLTPADRALRTAPPALVPLPCQGEFPTLPSAEITMQVADRASCPLLEPCSPRERVLLKPVPMASHPLPSRLDRPPRSLRAPRSASHA